MDEITKIIVEAIVSISIILITRYLIPWIKEKIGVEKYTTIKQYCELSVRSAEMLFTEEQWKEKKAYVVACVEAKLHEIGLEMTELEVNAIIEGFVQAVKNA